MVNNDAKILKPLDSLYNKLGEIEKYLMNMHIIAGELQEEAPFKENNSKKVRKIIRGGLLAPARRNILKLNNCFTEVTGLMDFYPQYGEKITSRSIYDQLRKDWKNNRNIRVYLGEINLHLSDNHENPFIKAAKEGLYGDLKKENFEGLMVTIVALLSIVRKLKQDTVALRRSYVNYGIDRGAF
ncbi:MAG TPA: hypothetical protein VJA23_06740 [Candidatus Nanoarchaeia archaeon]|nr:hypothetical protein [Candidatus Nanoarchaeia archaeon]